MHTFKAVVVFMMISSQTLFATAFALQKTTIDFWTVENDPYAIGIQEELAQQFEARKGIKIRVIPIDRKALYSKIITDFGTEDLPDVIYHPLELNSTLLMWGMSDADAATRVLHSLDVRTFAQNLLSFVRFGDKFSAVPADCWGMLLLYRKDLLEQYGLDTPNTWEKILSAVAVSHDPPSMWGIEIASYTEAVYTQQVFEGLALSNEVQLTDMLTGRMYPEQKLTETLRYYKRLHAFTPPGIFDLLTVENRYFAGRTAMTLLRPNVLSLIPERNKTGFVAAIGGPNQQAQYGDLDCFSIMRDSETSAAEAWVTFLLSDGYLSWLSAAPEANWPVRRGTLQDPSQFLRGWANLRLPTVQRDKIIDLYSPGQINSILSGTASIDRWGFSAGLGELALRVSKERIIPSVLMQYLPGTISAQQAAISAMESIKNLYEEELFQLDQ